MKPRSLILLVASILAIAPLTATTPTFGQNLTTTQVPANSRADRARAAASRLTGIPANRLAQRSNQPINVIISLKRTTAKAICKES